MLASRISREVGKKVSDGRKIAHVFHPTKTGEKENRGAAFALDHITCAIGWAVLGAEVNQTTRKTTCH